MLMLMVYDEVRTALPKILFTLHMHESQYSNYKENMWFLQIPATGVDVIRFDKCVHQCWRLSVPDWKLWMLSG